MVTCPKCRNDIPARKLLLLTRFSPSVVCPLCNSKLRWKNKDTGTLIGCVGGGVGGGLGGLFGAQWVFTGDLIYIAFIVATMGAVFFAVWGAMVKFTKFELDVAS